MIKNDPKSQPVKAPDTLKRSPKPGAERAASQPHTKPAGDERLSLSLERAEGEGMIAPVLELEGEGSYSATRRYNQGVARSVEAGQTDWLAHEAEEALEGPEGDELREAEEAAKRGQKA